MTLQPKLVIRIKPSACAKTNYTGHHFFSDSHRCKAGTTLIEDPYQLLLMQPSASRINGIDPNHFASIHLIPAAVPAKINLTVQFVFRLCGDKV
jgi:hypothetical protein